MLFLEVHHEFVEDRRSCHCGIVRIGFRICADAIAAADSNFGAAKTNVADSVHHIADKESDEER